jgi:transcriptional regulator with XRE-family HTH domain
MLRLKRERVLAELSQAALAREAGINANTISGTENGHVRPYPRQLEAMADALGWEGSPAELLEEVEDEAATR